LGYRLRLLLFIALIVVPAGGLTFLSLRAVLDEQRSALADVRLRLPAVQAAFQSQLLNAMDTALAAGPVGDTGPEVEFAFDLNDSGEFADPVVLRPGFIDRSPAFEAALQRGESLELLSGDPTAARNAYDEAHALAASDAERVEALNALQRARVAIGDTAQTLELHNILRGQYVQTLDPDGAHPLTLSYLRQARRRLPTTRTDGTLADSNEVDVGLASITEWVTGVLVGDIPLHPGSALAAREFRAAVHRRRWDRDVVSLQADLDRIERRADFIVAYDRLLETAVVRPEGTYLSGLGAGGRSWFAVLQPPSEGITRGVVLNLDGLAEATLSTPVGAQLLVAGFGLVLFDADFTAEFERRYARQVHIIAPVDSRNYRLNVGLYARDEPFVFAHYRNRNASVMAGILLLAGAIGLGAYVLVRETARERQTAHLQAEFVSNVSHELRTPLTSIRMYAETLLLERYRTDEQRQQYLQTIMRESQRLSRMVGNILDFSRMASGRKSWDFVDTDVAATLRTAMEEFEPMLVEQGFVVEVVIADSLPIVRADPDALETAVANLLSNAIRYSPERKDIRVSLQSTAGQIVLEVADRGVGIPQGESRLVFEKYQRASNAAAVATGTGLGLALVAGIAESHSGTVQVLPREGGGSLFRLALPIQR
jgi:signal transduction histidine kinase